MPTARQLNPVARRERPGWLGLGLALFLVAAQAFALVHQFDHPITGTDSECAFCIGGHGLDQVAIPQAADLARPDTANCTFAPRALAQRAPTVHFTHARGPPVFLAA